MSGEDYTIITSNDSELGQMTSNEILCSLLCLSCTSLSFEFVQQVNDSRQQNGVQQLIKYSLSFSWT